MIDKRLKTGIIVLAIGIVGYIGYKKISKMFVEKKLRDSVKEGESETKPTPQTVKPNDITANINKLAYPKADYVNVRETPNVNNGIINNFIGKVTRGKIVGKVLGGDIQGDGYVWYRLALVGQNLSDDKDLGKAEKDRTTGYVREDNILIK